MLKIECEVEARDPKGKIIDRRVIADDLVVKNLRRVLGGLMQRDCQIIDGFVDITGTARSLYIWYETTYLFNHEPFGLSYVRMAVGTGTASPTVNDYALQTEVASGTSPTKTVVWAADHTVTIYYAMSFTLAEAKDITESGIWFQMDDSAGTPRWFLLARDTFAAVSVPAGGTISVTYKITTSF